MLKISHANYKDVPAVVLENEVLQLTFLPANGGKFASLVGKKSGREFLVQEKGEKYKVQPYDGDYTTGECSGFDDMFPTIDPAAYPSFPWKGAVMPDHGEVSALSWQCEELADGLHLATRGCRFPYKFEKTITFAAPNRIRLAYCVTNESDFPFECLYAAHTMLNTEEGGEVLIPCAPGEEAATWGFSRFPAGCNYSDKLHWPYAELPDGSRVALNKAKKFNADGNNYKFFLDHPLKAGWCGYRAPDGVTFKLHFDPEELPAFCLWANEGWFHGYQNIALEPCSAGYDRVDIAKLHGQITPLAPHAARTWTLEMEIIE